MDLPVLSMHQGAPREVQGRCRPSKTRAIPLSVRQPVHSARPHCQRPGSHCPVGRGRADAAAGRVQRHQPAPAVTRTARAADRAAARSRRPTRGRAASAGRTAPRRSGCRCPAARPRTPRPGAARSGPGAVHRDTIRPHTEYGTCRSRRPALGLDPAADRRVWIGRVGRIERAPGQRPAAARVDHLDPPRRRADQPGAQHLVAAHNDSAVAIRRAKTVSIGAAIRLTGLLVVKLYARSDFEPIAQSASPPVRPPSPPTPRSPGTLLLPTSSRSIALPDRKPS